MAKNRDNPTLNKVFVTTQQETARGNSLGSFLATDCPGEHGGLFCPDGFFHTGLSKEYLKNQARRFRIYELDPLTCLEGGLLLRFEGSLGATT